MEISTRISSRALASARAGRLLSAASWRQRQDRGAHYVSRGLMAALFLFLLLLIGMLITQSWPLLAGQSFWAIVTSTEWHPTNGRFGMAPFIAGSVAVTVVALLTAAPPAILSGIYLAEYLRPRQRSLIRPLLELLVGLPSVVFGLWGIVVIVPLVREVIMPWSHQTLGQFHPFFAGGNTTGYGLLTAGLVLGISVFPLIAAVTQEVLLTIPQAARETALCLGATRWEATKIIVFRHGLPGIGAAVVLAFARAFGETLAVLMLAGNVVQMPNNLFDGVYTLPALIANNYGEMMSVPLYQSALMLAALVLLLVVLIFNLLARLIILRLERRVQ